MPKLTDEQLGDLLRETFTDHADDLKSLPEATKRRRIAPALVAAAAVVTVLAGTVMNGSINTAQRPAPTAPPPAAARTVSEDAQIWSTVASMVIQAKAPQRGVALAAADVEISEVQRNDIAEAVGQGNKVSWVQLQPRHASPQKTTAYESCLKLDIPIVFLGKVVGKGRDREVRAGVSEGCGYKESALYRLEKQGNTWMVESVSNVTQSIPQGR
ncbi:hypothetical protein GCM10029976_055400 [Kribbella albertanoniae]|uniref:Uncharacterized protein n=1 Tax=Kribbella albertanoniae TaxID=1266829 RepID=A0A4R4P433_9ACTN|nr:hypothetical protein [Kribbella albertanoniae]TDC17151.1 hypothetical protein E1261_37630 [Kribbella albertanoniae]